MANKTKYKDQVRLYARTSKKTLDWLDEAAYKYNVSRSDIINLCIHATKPIIESKFKVINEPKKS